MATGLEGDIASLQPVEDEDSKQDSEKSKDKDETTNTVSYKLFSFADSLDRLLMLMGTVGAIGNGISLPLMVIISGTMINAFGESTTSKVVDEVSKVIF